MSEHSQQEGPNEEVIIIFDNLSQIKYLSFKHFSIIVFSYLMNGLTLQKY